MGKKKVCINHVCDDKQNEIANVINEHIKDNINNGLYTIDAVEDENSSRIQSNSISENFRLVKNGSSTIIEIPVVFYINYAYTTTADVVKYTDSFIKSLNDNYSKTSAIVPPKATPGKFAAQYNNFLALWSPVAITFVKLGIVYRQAYNITSSNTASIDSTVKSNSVPSANYGKTLNVWLVKFSNGLLGYAQFPWDLKTKPQYDGVVIDYRTIDPAFKYAPYNLNRTAVHEIGHWLGLYHTFQSNPITSASVIDTDKNNTISKGESTGDCISDTPPQANPTYGNPASKAATTWPTYSGQLVMFTNYMDYTDDVGMFMFTAEQAKKIVVMINTFRPLLAQ